MSFISNSCTKGLADLCVSHAAPLRLSPCDGGMNTTDTVLDPHRGQRSRLATIESGKSRPRVATSVSMSRS